MDTNILVRMATGDDPAQVQRIRAVLKKHENQKNAFLVLPEVIVETVWVLESYYRLKREDVAWFVEMLLLTDAFAVSSREAVQAAVRSYKQRGGFADALIVAGSKALGAKCVLSFDKAMRKLDPGYVVEP